MDKFNNGISNINDACCYRYIDKCISIYSSNIYYLLSYSVYIIVLNHYI